MARYLDQKAVAQGSVNEGKGHDLVKQTFQIFIECLDDILQRYKRRSGSWLRPTTFDMHGGVHVACQSTLYI